MIAHGPYDVFNHATCATIKRFKIEDAFYLNNNIQDMKPFEEGSEITNYRINNLKRQTSVVVRTVTGADIDAGPELLSGDNSLVTLGTLLNLDSGNAPSDLGWKDESKTAEFNRNITSHYAALKYRIVNQYGQLEFN